MSVEISPKSKDRSLKQVVSDLRSDAGLLVRQEIALAKAELTEKVRGVAKRAAMVGAAGLLAYGGLLVLLAAIILALIAIGVAAWLAALTVGLVVLLGAFLIVQRARRPKENPPQ
ncbi:MAG: phage holin family protein [Gemmatimonadales bacterium]